MLLIKYFIFKYLKIILNNFGMYFSIVFDTMYVFEDRKRTVSKEFCTGNYQNTPECVLLLCEK